MIRQRIGMIFQHFNLLSAKTVIENVTLPLKLQNVPRVERQRRGEELLEMVGLGDKAKTYPAKLSGGQKQRVGIARALACNPSLLLCDEATSALDPETTLSILELLRGINQKLGLSIVLITHEMNVLRQIAEQTLVLAGGRVVENGTTQEIFKNPRSPEALLMLGRRGLCRRMRMSGLPYSDLFTCFLQTLQMVGLAGLISLCGGSAIGAVAGVDGPARDRAECFRQPGVGTIVNPVRSVPFIILLVAVIPLTRLIVGTAIGTMSAVVPLAIAATPYYARIAEVSLRGVDGAGRGSACHGGQPAGDHH